MEAGIREHLPAIIVITLIGIATAALGLSQVHAGASGMSVDAFQTLIFLVPCAVMLVGSFAIAATASVIGRQLYMTVLAICLATGVVSMLVTSTWLSNADIAAALLANSGDGAQITPILQSPLLVLRDIAAYVVVPTVGCIAGAWVGSRLHPLSSAKKNRTSKRK